MATTGLIRQRWQEWSARFAALQQREKFMVIGCVVIAIVFGGFTLWIEPGQLQTNRLKKSLEQQQTEMTQLSTQLLALAAQNTDPNAANRAVLEDLRQQLAGTDRSLKGFDRTLVAPTQAPELLQTLLARHRGLKMLSLTTLAAQPLIEPPASREKDEKGRSDKPKLEAPQPGSNIYKHGIEIKVAGGYHDLLAYVADLEASPQKLLWGGMRLAVKEHPVSELTLTVYSLSLEARWLVV